MDSGFPVKPGGHWHEYAPKLFVQMAPWPHKPEGPFLESHSSISEI